MFLVAVFFIFKPRAAKLADWLSPGPQEYPRGSHAGYGLVQDDDQMRIQNRSTQVVDLLAEAKTRCKADLVERGKANEWTTEELDRTAEAIGYGAVKYADLKNHRSQIYTLNFDQMFNDTGNTAVHLLHVHAEICSIIRKSGKDMNELKKEGEIKLETDKERVLGLYLLEFTGTIKETCEYVLPHILCEYLYNLSEKFTSFCSLSSVRQVEKDQPSVGQTEEREGSYNCKLCKCRPLNNMKELENHLRYGCLVLKNRELEKFFGHEQTSRLLLCEATAVVMRKCFCLLGITPVYSI